MKAIAPHFVDELRAAGLLGLPFAWGADGSFTYDLAITPAQRAAIEAVYAAHNPTDPAAAAAYATSQKDAELDAGKAVKALAEWTRRELNLIRAALPSSLSPITASEVLNGRPEQPAGLKQIYRALP